MTENGPRDQTAKQNTGRWIAYGAILAGVICIVVGVAILSWTPETPAAAANTHPTPDAHPQVATSPLNTLVILTPLPATTSLPKPTATRIVAPTHTPSPQVTPDTPTPVQLTGGLFHLAIVHSNDTWGYTLPCG
jgi:hypothetical protein